MKNFIDGVDVNPRISLFEYGILRNPKTNKTLMCINIYEHLYSGKQPKIYVDYISTDDVAEALEDMPDGFWDFTDIDKDLVLNNLDNLDNNDLSLWIYDINQWNGKFLPY